MTHVPFVVDYREWLDPAPASGLSRASVLRLIQEEAERRYPHLNIGCHWADRRPGHDEHPSIPENMHVAEVYHWLRLAERVEDSDIEYPLERALAVAPARSAGDPWYVCLGVVTVSGLE